MPIRWSALRVVEAMDEIEGELNAAQPVIDKALHRVKEARQIPHLPGYIDQRLMRLVYDIENKWSKIRFGIDAVRNAIPERAAEIERKRGRQDNLGF